MTRHRTARLVIHLGRHQAHYALLLRTVDGRDYTDRRLSWGQLPLPERPDEPKDLLALLERAVADLCRRHRVSPGAAGREPLGAVGGGPIADSEDTLPLFIVSRDGQTLDSDGNPL